MAQAEALESIGVPDSVADVILRRLSRVSALARDALTVAATIGPEFDLAIVEALAREARRRRRASSRRSRRRWRPASSPRWRSPSTASRSATRSPATRSTAACRARGACACTCASQRARGGRRAARRARAPLLRRARDRRRRSGPCATAVLAGEEAAASLAYEDSVEHYRRALEAIGADRQADEARPLRHPAGARPRPVAGRRRGRALDLRGGGDERAASAAPRSSSAARRSGSASATGRPAPSPSATPSSSPRPSRGCPRQDSALRARLMGRMAENLHFTADQGYGMQLSADALAMARRLGDAETLAMALMSRHVTLLHIEHLDERVALSDEVVALTAEHRALRAEALHWRLLDVCELGAHEQARRDHAELRALAARAAPAAARAPRDRLGRRVRAPRRRHRGGGAAREPIVPGGRPRAGPPCQQLSRRDALHAAPPAGPHRRAAGVDGGACRRRLGEPRVERRARARPGRDGRGGGGPRALRPRSPPTARARCHATGSGCSRSSCSPRPPARSTTPSRAQELYDLLAPHGDRFVQVIFAANMGSVRRQLGMLATVTGALRRRGGALSARRSPPTRRSAPC